MSDDTIYVGDISKDQQNVHIVDSVDLILYLVLLIITILTLWIFKKKRLKFLHESGLAVMFGLAVGAVLRYTGSSPDLVTVDVEMVDSNISSVGVPDIVKLNVTNHGVVQYKLNNRDVGSSQVQEKATFDPELFFYVILPPIIFHAGYSMQKKQFFDNIGSILTFALAGTVISTLIISSVVWFFLQFVSSIEVRFLDSLYFGAIISATDPVTSLVIFSDLKVDPLLNSLLLGESLVNDAVAIVLCGAIEGYSSLYLKGEPDTFELEAFLRTIGNFFGILLGSVGLGCLMGLLTSFLTKYTRVKDFELLETSLFSLLSYSSYLFAEICSMSGIVSILFCGIFQAHYTYHNLSQNSRVRTRQLFELSNFLLENFIFSYIGVSMFTFTDHLFHFGFIFGSFFAILIARALNIYPLSFLLNLGRKPKIPLNFQHMLTFSGLRGAMAFALAMKDTTTEAKRMFLTTTSLIAIVTVIVCGGMTAPLLSMLKIPTGVDNTEEEVDIEETCETGSSKSQSWLAKTWKKVDNALLRPLLTNRQPSLQETLPWLGPVATWLTTTEQMIGDTRSTG